MREILFRGKRIDNGKWAYGYLIEQDNPEYHTYIIRNFLTEIDKENIDVTNLDIVEVDAKTVGQYTGMLDKNGNKIFEGDICSFCNTDGELINYEVLWFGRKWVVREANSNAVDDLDLFFCERSAVIGNIYDNQELLRGEE